MKYVWNIVGTVLLIWFIWRIIQKSDDGYDDVVDKDVSGRISKKKIKPSPEIMIQSDYIDLLSDKFPSEAFQSPEYMNDIIDYSGGQIVLPTGRELTDLIKSEYVDEDYKFNVSAQPVTTKSGIKDKRDKKIVKKIYKMVDGWNELFYKYFQQSGKLLKATEINVPFIKETCDDFFVDAYIKIVYQQKSLHIHVNIYGVVEKTGNFFSGKVEEYALQLVSIKPISAEDYGNQSGLIEIKPFMGMDDAMKYVKHMDSVRKTEATDIDPTKCRKYIGEDDFCYYGEDRH